MSDPMDTQQVEEKTQPADAPAPAETKPAASHAEDNGNGNGNGTADKPAAAAAAAAASPTPAAAPAAPAPSAPAAAKDTINPKVFWNRLHAIFDAWKKGGKPWGAMPPAGAPATAPATGPAVDSIVLVYGPADQDSDEYDRATAVQMYLFGWEFPDTMLAFCREPDTLLVLTSAKKCRMLEAIAKDVNPQPIKLQLHIANKADKNAANIQTIVKALKQSKSGKRCGTIADKKEGASSAPLASSLQAALKKSGLTDTSVDVSAGFAGVLAIKDKLALECVAKAADYSTKVMKKFLIQKMEDIIEKEEKVAQDTLADLTDDAIKEPAKIGVATLNKDDLDSCYSPIIQSGSLGEKFDLRPSAQSSSNPLAYDAATTIILQLGARYKYFCSNIGRTYFINPVEEQKAVYLVLTDVFVACKKALKDKQRISGVMQAAHQAIRDAKRPDLIPHFTKSCGFGMGLEFRESTLVINDKNQKTLQKGMVFNLCIGFTDLTTKASKATGGVARNYAVLLADTVVVTPDGGEPDSLTRLPREFGAVSYTMGDEAEEAQEGTMDGDAEAAMYVAAAADRRTTRGVGKDSLRTDQAAQETDEKRAAHQALLARKKQEEALRRLAAGTMEQGGHASSTFDLSTLNVYASVNDMPSARFNRVTVDSSADSVLFPIHDQLVPFHISTITRVYKRDENGFTFLNVKFQVPDTAANRAKMKVQRGFQYISELTYRTATTSLDKPYFDMEQMRKNWINRVKEEEVKSSLVIQEELKLDRKGPPPMLKDISVRPHLSRKKTTGTLSAHLNGLRFVTTDKIKVDIIYANIKSAFYQPAEEGNHNVTIHFELKDPILLDKSKTKKTNHLQFFVEVVESSEDLSMSSRFRDEDGLAEEQEERRRKKKWNERFLQFVKEVEDKFQKEPSHSSSKLEFDIPYKELSFTGVPAKQQVQIMPTVHSLVALDDNPPMVVNLQDVEIACFERIQFGLKNFDLVFVWKDFKKLPMRIEAIPIKSFEPIKHWLNSCDIVFYESSQNILWKTVMKQINDDVEGFWQDGGFDIFLSRNAEDGGTSDEDEEEEEEEEEEAEAAEGDGKSKAKSKKKKKKDEESESDFEPSDESGSDSEEYETPTDEESSGSSDDSGGDSDSEGERSMGWDELEEQAKKQDKERAVKARMKEGSDADLSSGDSDEEERRRERKKKKNNAPPPSSKPASSSSSSKGFSSKPAFGVPPKRK